MSRMTIADKNMAYRTALPQDEIKENVQTAAQAKFRSNLRKSFHNRKSNLEPAMV